MSDSLLNDLQKSADDALKSKTVDEGVKHLAKAFSLFAKETSRLKIAYQNLQDQFSAVNLELEKSNQSLIDKIEKLDFLSKYLKNILKNISQGIIFINIKGEITTFNDAASDILEKEEKTLLFKQFWNHFTDDFFGFSLKDALHFGLSHRLNYIRITTEDKKQKQIEISTDFVFNGPKDHQGIIILLRDITQMEKLRLIANRNDQMKELGEMAATVAHEIRNPLGGIRGYATLLYRDLMDTPSMQQMAGYIIEGTKSLERLVSNVLHYARPLQLKIEWVNLASLLVDLTESIRVDTSFSKDILVTLHLPEKSLFAPVDQGLLRLCFLNLIVNAYQAMTQKGEFTISLIQQNGGCMITFSDTGSGIEEKDIQKIFSPFFTTKEKGNGLGLSEVYKIIQAHLGTIEVHSQVGKGTTFSIFLPLKMEHVHGYRKNLSN